MQCKNCGKKIDTGNFCVDCIIKLKKESSKSEMKVLEELIEQQKKLNVLEQTKELPNIKDLNETQNITEEENINIESIETPENETKEVLSREEKNKSKKSKKGLIIAIIIILVLVIVAIVGFFIITSSNKEEKTPVETIDYQSIINEYGNHVETALVNFPKEDDTLITWKDINDVIDYTKYEVVCDIHEIYEDNKIYLNGCMVDGKAISYSYGSKQEIKKEGLTLNIYKETTDNKVLYTSDPKNGIKIGSVTCESLDCEFIKGYEKYVLVSDDSKYYLYNYIDNVLAYGPVKLSDSKDYYEILSYDNIVYGIYEKDSNSIYNILSNKTFKNISGDLQKVNFTYNPFVMLKYGYVVLYNNDKTDFISLKSGKVSYTIDESISSFVEDETSKMVYIRIDDYETNKITLYNSNGKLLFGGNKLNDFILTNGNIVISYDNTYEIYDSNLNKKLTSKTYDSVLGLFEDYVVVVDNKHLEILDMSDNILTTFDDEYTDSDVFYKMLSGIEDIDGEVGISLVIEHTDEENNTTNVRYYYIPKTQESGKR